MPTLRPGEAVAVGGKAGPWPHPAAPPAGGGNGAGRGGGTVAQGWGLPTLRGCLYKEGVQPLPLTP